jgi:hypothetical protein
MMLAQMRLVFGISDERIHEQLERKFEKLEQYSQYQSENLSEGGE